MLIWNWEAQMNNTNEMVEFREQGPMRSYFSISYNILEELDLDPYAYRLYCYYRNVAGSNGNGVCYQSKETISKATKMSRSTIKEKNIILSQPLEMLEGKSLIQCVERKNDKGECETTVIYVNDLMLDNSKKFASRPPKNLGGGVGRHTTGGGRPLNGHKEEDIAMSSNLLLKDNVLDNVSQMSEMEEAEMVKAISAHLDKIEKQSSEDFEQTLTFSQEKVDIEKTPEIRGVKSKYPLKKEQVPVFQKIKSMKLECDDDTIMLLIRQNWAKGVQFFEDCLHHLNYLLSSGRAAIKSRIAFFRDCLKGSQSLITELSLKNMQAAKKYADKAQWKSVKITEKYVQCLITGKEVSTNISFDEFKRCVVAMFTSQHQTA